MSVTFEIIGHSCPLIICWASEENIVKRTIFFSFLFIATIDVNAADLKQRIALYGVGASSCGSLVQAWQESSPDVGVQREGQLFRSKASLYQEWIAGFVSATNMSNETGDVAAGSDIQGITRWVRNYCEANPTHLVSRAVTAFVSENTQTSKTIGPTR